GLESVKSLRRGQPRDHRLRAAAATVGRGDRFGVAPQLGAMRIVGCEYADDGPVLTCDTQCLAHAQPGELAFRALADVEFAHAGFEFSSLDDLDVGPDRPCFVTDAADRDVGVRRGIALL